MLDVVVVGAGVSGLVAAHKLLQKGMSVEIIEASARAGGVIGSCGKNSFLVEKGPNSSLSKPPLIDLVEELNISEQLVYPSEKAKNRFIVTKNRKELVLSPVPYSPQALLSTPILSKRGKIRALIEPLVRSKLDSSYDSDESVAAFISKRFGEEVTQQIAAPLLGGIWAADINKLSCRSALPELWKTGQSSNSLILSGLRAAKKKRQFKGKPLPKLVSFKNGMETLVQELIRQSVGTCLNLNTELVEVEKCEDHFLLTLRDSRSSETKQISCKKLILAVSAKAAAKIIKKQDPTLSHALEQIPYAPLGILHLAFPKDAVGHALDGFGFLVPPPLKLATLGSIFCSSLFSNRSPAGYHLLTCFAGGARSPEFAKVENPIIQKRVINEVSQLIQATSSPEVVGLEQWEAAIPNYPLAHHLTQSLVDSFEANNRDILLLGNWRNGVSICDRIREAEAAAETIYENYLEQGDRELRKQA